MVSRVMHWIFHPYCVCSECCQEFFIFNLLYFFFWSLEWSRLHQRPSGFKQVYLARAFLGHTCNATVHTSWFCSQRLTHKATMPSPLPRHWISLHASYHIYNLWLTGVVCALLVLYHLLLHFEVFLNVDIHYLSISTVDLSTEIWSNAYTTTGYNQMGFMFPVSCGTSLKFWAQCQIWGKTEVKLLVASLGLWLQLLKHLRPPGTNNLLKWERRVRASFVPRRLNGFWNPFNPTQSLQQKKDWPIHCKDMASIWIWTREGGGWEVTRRRSSAETWRCLISNTLSHSLGTNIFAPQFFSPRFNDKA